MKVQQMVIAAVFLWLLAIAGISNANAAQLSVMTGGQATLVTLSKCADAALASTSAGTPTSGGTVYPSVALSNIPVACRGLLFELRVFGAGGTLLAAGTATPTTSTRVFATGNYTAANVTAVVVRIDGWVFPTTWTAPPPPAPAPPTVSACAVIQTNNGSNVGPCTVTDVVVGAPVADGNGGYKWTITFNVTPNTTMNSQRRWEVTFDFSNSYLTPRFAGAPNSNLVRGTEIPGYSCTSLASSRILKVQAVNHPQAGGTIVMGTGPTPVGFTGTVLCNNP